jgi:Fe-S-cluster containining protein
MNCEPLEELAQLHEEVERKARALARRHVDRLECRRGCSQCCVDDLTVFEIEAERIRRHHRSLLASARPHSPGRCAFLDQDGACRVYDDRPYVCRTQGLPLRWFEDDDRGRTVELRDICPLNDRPDAPLGGLSDEDCWTIGPFEQRLAELQQQYEGALRRVRLRNLFDVTPKVAD